MDLDDQKDRALVFSYWVVQKFGFWFFLNEKHQGGVYEIVLISVLYGWFLQILKNSVSKLICPRLCILTTTQQCKLFKKEVFLKPYLSYVILVRIDSKVKFISVSSMNFQTFSKCQIVLEPGLFSKPLWSMYSIFIENVHCKYL